ncbi:MAG: transcriptional repressor [Eubacteriales bacterium]|nr:transcriptional repressor [Eubacteriales bacterium]
MTNQRKTIYDVIIGSPEHLSAEEIYLRAKKRYPSLAMGTVYRNLKLMEDAGEILHIRTPDGADRYDKTTSKHDHMECIQCGQFVDLPTHDLLGLIREQTGMEIQSYQINAKGICSECMNKN